MKTCSVSIDYGSEVFFRHRIHTSSVAHPAAYPMGAGVSFTRGKAAGREF
jgi:hypothetical protein